MARSATIRRSRCRSCDRAEAYKGLDESVDRAWHQSAHVSAVSHVIAKRFTH
jgi:hypothetical protein